MKKIKRVALVDPKSDYIVADYTEEYPSSTRDIDILNLLYEVGKTFWHKGDLYLLTSNGLLLKHMVYSVRVSIR